MSGKFPLIDFNKRFPDVNACLEEIKQLRYPNGVECKKCQKVTKHYKVKGRTAYACEFCGTHIFPLAGTIFEKTSTPLTYWFYAMYVMVQTRGGISAKQLERELGVTYKTAWRIFNHIRTLMTQGGEDILSGIVEVDETFMGGKGINRRYVPNFNEKPKEVVVGMVERGGKAVTKHVPNTGNIRY
jgi:transposase